MKRLSKEQRLYIYDSLTSIWIWEKIYIKDSIEWDILENIFEEWMNMESKNGNKSEKSLIKYLSELPAQWTEHNSEPIVYDSIVKDNIVKDSIQSVAPKVATLETYIKTEFSLDFITEVYNKYWMTKEDFQEECEHFLNYWKEKSINWKKERWEKEKTFDPKLRFRTWMKNSKKWSNRVIVNSEDEERNKKLAEIEEKKKALFNNS